MSNITIPQPDLQIAEVIASFYVRNSNKHPPKSNWYDGNTSDKVFAKCKTTSGKITIDIVIYDYHSNKWRFISAGCCEVIEWYDPKLPE